MSSKVNNQQKMPLETYGDICRNIGLNWPMAQVLFESDFLSYEPRYDAYPEDEALDELLFIGLIIASGCTLETLSFVLKTLNKPYTYSHQDVYFNWVSTQWSDIPKQEESCKVALNYISELEEEKDIDSLLMLKKHTEEAISQLNPSE